MKRFNILHALIIQALIVASTIAAVVVPMDIQPGVYHTAVKPAPKIGPPIPASPPGNVTASNGTFTDHVEVTWVGVPTANKYYIFRDTDPGGAAMVQIGSKSSHSYKDFAVTDMQVYYYWVQACNKSGCSAISTSDSGYAQSNEIPASAPANLTASDGSFTDLVSLSWDTAADATEYQIFRDTDPGGAAMTQINTTTALSYDDPAVVDLQVYHYWVKACSISGCSAVSTPDSGYAQLYPIPVNGPANVTASDGTFTDHVEINWDAVADATEYQIFRDTDPGGGAMAQIGISAALSFNDAAVVDLQAYHYWVKACSISGCSPVSTPDSGYAEAITGGIIFWDDFETGDFSQWTRFNSGGDWLYPCTKAGINGIWGACVERGTNDRRKQLIDETPIDQANFNVRFNFDINSLSMGNGERFRFMQVKMGAERPFFIVLLNRDGNYEIQLNALLEDLTKVKTGWYPLADRPVTIEVNWEAASADGANDGYAELYINDLLQEALTGLDNDTIFVDTFKIGFTSRLEGKLISGVFHVDDVFTSNGGHIGLP